MSKSQNSLVIFTQASQLLAQADTIQKAKELKDLSITAGEWAKRKKMGEEAVQHCREYALRAEYRLGELLTQTERRTASHSKGGGSKGTKREPLPDAPPTLAALGISKKESSRAQKLVKSVPAEKLDAFILEKKAAPHVSHNSGENEWYTPPEYIEAAREVMGKIECDPASSNSANATVRAGNFFTRETDGLKQTWGETVWMNPPYSQPLVSRFSESIAKKFSDGEVRQACVLVNNATETEWFQGMLSKVSCVCFIKGRVRFLNKDGDRIGAPLQGQAILYFGENHSKFAEAFSRFGIVMRK